MSLLLVSWRVQRELRFSSLMLGVKMQWRLLHECVLEGSVAGDIVREIAGT